MAYVKYELTLGNLLKSSTVRNPGQEIVDSEFGRTTFSKFGTDVTSLAKGLVKIGVEPGDKIGILDWDF